MSRILELARRRRSVREFDPDVRVSLAAVLRAIEAALQAPSGSNQQPWFFVVIEDAEVKGRIRNACERAEKRFHEGLRGEFAEWLRSRGISWRKPFLEKAPYLIAVFSISGKPFSIQSTWLAVGYLLLALEEEGLASLTYTPPNPSEIADILGAPREARLQTIIPVGREKGRKEKEPRARLGEKVFLNRWGAPLPPSVD